MQILEAQYQIVTPMFIGGVHQSSVFTNIAKVIEAVWNSK
jgi:hypothetical protein